MSRLLCLAVLLTLLPTFARGNEALSLTGTVTNITNPKNEIKANITISFDGTGDCNLRIDAPLYGSGPCAVQSLNESTQSLTLISNGPSGRITWTGIDSGTEFKGTYTVKYPNYPQLADFGTFSLKYDQKPVILHLPDVLTRIDFVDDGHNCHALAERDLASIFDEDFNYLGVRIVFDDKQNPIIRIEDHKDGSLYVDVKNNATLMEWHTDGKEGYFSKSSDGVTSYYDRYMNYTSWFSVRSGDQTIYVQQMGASLELYDATFKALNIRSEKTSSGKVFWAKTDSDGFTEYFDDSMKPMNWYSAVRNGLTYYAHVQGKKVKVYDASLRPIQHDSNFWAKLRRGLGAGLAAYGQDLRARAAAQTQTSAYSGPGTSHNANTQQIGSFNYTDSTDSDGSSYTTSTQRIGSMEYSTTTGSNGYYASTNQQRIGTFGYINGYDSDGSISGTTQRIGNFDYSSYTTPRGSWNGTSQQIGNFTFHSISAPDGSVHPGTTQRIGDFLYTTIQ